MKFNKVKGKASHLWKKKPKHQCRLEDDHREGTSAEEDLRPCHEYTLPPKKASGILDCIRQGTASHSRKVIISQLFSMVESHLEFWAQFWAPLHKTGTAAEI